MSNSSLIPATSLSSPTSFRDLAGMSNTPRTDIKRRRRVMHAAVLTSSPYKMQLEESVARPIGRKASSKTVSSPVVVVVVVLIRPSSRQVSSWCCQ